MKYISPLWPTMKVGLWATLLMVSGCARTLHLKVVDAAGQKPLDDVHMTWIRVQPGFLKTVTAERVEMSLTSAAEGVPIRNVSADGNHTFTFTKPGYHKATLVYHHGKGFIDSPDLVKPGEAVSRTSVELMNPIVVPLHRISEAQHQP